MSTSSEASLASTLLSVLFSCIFVLILLLILVTLNRTWIKSIKNRLKEAKNMRKNTQDLFRKQYGYSWDYVMVFKVHQEDVVLDDYQMTYSIRNILYSLAQGGLEIRLFYSVKRHKVFCKIRCNLARLQKHADQISYLLPFDEEKLKKNVVKVVINYGVL